MADKVDKKLLRRLKRRFKTITIHGQVYKIKWVKQLTGKNKGCGAECDWTNRTLVFTEWVASNEYKFMWYLLHEIKHASQFITGLYQVLDEQAIEYDADGFATLHLELKAQGVFD